MKTERNMDYSNIAIFPQKASLGFSSTLLHTLHSLCGACCRLIIIRSCSGILQRLPSFSAVCARRTTREPDRENIRERMHQRTVSRHARDQTAAQQHRKQEETLCLKVSIFFYTACKCILNSGVVCTGHWNVLFQFQIWFTAN